MVDSIKYFYQRLSNMPEIVQLVQHYYGKKAGPVLGAMLSGDDVQEADEDLEDLLRDFVTAHAIEVAVFQGLGQVDSNSKDAIDYFEKYHPEAHLMMLSGAEELQKLLGKDAAAAALGQSREPFAIKVLQYEFLYIVTAEEFEDVFFDTRTRLSSSQNPATRRSSKMLRSGYRTFEVHRLTPMYVPP